MSDTQFGIFLIIAMVIWFYFWAKSESAKSTDAIVGQAPTIQAPHPLEHLIQETQNFSYIKFDGSTVYHCVSTSVDAPLAIKELKFFKKILNADKKAISDELRTIRANIAGAKGLISTPHRSGLVKGIRYGVRAGTALVTLPLENQKSLYNSLLLQCDRVQIDIEKL